MNTKKEKWRREKYQKDRLEREKKKENKRSKGEENQRGKMKSRGPGLNEIEQENHEFLIWSIILTNRDPLTPRRRLMRRCREWKYGCARQVLGARLIQRGTAGLRVLVRARLRVTACERSRWHPRAWDRDETAADFRRDFQSQPNREMSLLN